MKHITQKRVHELLRYCPETGQFHWRRTAALRLAGKVAGTINSWGYRVIGIDGKTWIASRIAWVFVHGQLPEGQIDHINGVRSDDRICNLREVTPGQNRRNQQLRKDNSTGRIGVYWHAGAQKWMASIQFRNKQYHLGLFEDFNAAVDAREKAERKFGFHQNHGRLPIWEAA